MCVCVCVCVCVVLFSKICLAHNPLYSNTSLKIYSNKTVSIYFPSLSDNLKGRCNILFKEEQNHCKEHCKDLVAIPPGQLIIVTTRLV